MNFDMPVYHAPDFSQEKSCIFVKVGVYCSYVE